MQGVPTDDELEDLSRNIGAKWKSLGRRLNFSDEKLQEIDSGRRLLPQKAYQMLKKWKQRNGSGATYQTLCAALSHRLVSRTDLAEKYDNCDDQEPPGHASQQPLTSGSGSSQSVRTTNTKKQKPEATNKTNHKEKKASPKKVPMEKAGANIRKNGKEDRVKDD